MAGCTGTQGGATVQDNPAPAETVTITDGAGRSVTVPATIEHVVCSGSGSLRYLTYLGAQDRIVGVDDIEKREQPMDARPYFLANPQFKDYPLIGEFRGHDDPEKILALKPDVIFKTYATSGYDPEELQQKTGIPVVVLNYGDLSFHRDDFCQSLRTMGKVLGTDDRAEEVIAFFDERIADLDTRTKDVPDSEKTRAYVGGIAYRGAHGLQSTETSYPPFVFVNAVNVAYDTSKAPDEQLQTGTPVAKEKILEWDPEIIFVDLATLQLTDGSSAIDELKNDPSYAGLSAKKNGEVYGVLPYNWYSQNQGSILADAYYVGKVLYPDQFADIDPAAEADEIYTFLVKKPVFGEMNDDFQQMAFTKLSI
ncbi:iron ABC transporter substrate-binding protein [Methanofollis aquaemaris]|uniref:Iron ABC transporter substrate-binding protein n=1 Tax=Methanofollis aquaemaris TaxID=126734 RepID=A0A8A3SAG3_9EURY|nr:iron ABC transporter substrate-binding protein [Methanofollis aquaemaris]